MGYGNSSTPSKREDYAIENLLEDVAHLIDAADVDETVLLAHDWGAVVGWLFAIRKVRPLEKLIICNVLIGYYKCFICFIASACPSEILEVLYRSNLYYFLKIVMQNQNIF